MITGEHSTSGRSTPALALRLAAPGGWRRGVAWGGVTLLAFVSISGTWDVLRFNQAVAEAYQSLRARGVPAAEIDAGYSLTGWILYAHPENLPPGAALTDSFSSTEALGMGVSVAQKGVDVPAAAFMTGPNAIVIDDDAANRSPAADEDHDVADLLRDAEPDDRRGRR